MAHCATVRYQADSVLPGDVEGVFPILRLAAASDPEDLHSKQQLAPVAEIIPAQAWVRDALKIVAALESVAQMVALHQMDPGLLPHDIERIGGPVDSAGTPVESALFGVVNLSFEPGSALHPLAPGDIVQIATWALSHACLPVAAAGNRGLLPGVESVSAWAQAPWVVGVGATEDEAGTRLWSRSGRGVPDHPKSGPSCVAWGASSLNTSLLGTSFAAPRVTRLALLACAAILQVQAALRRARGMPGAVRLVGAGIVDTFSSQDVSETPDDGRSPERAWWPHSGRSMEPSLPVVAFTPPTARLWETLAATGVDIVGGPQQIRSLLLTCARPVAGHGAHEVGAGFLDLDVVVAGLSHLRAGDWLEVLGLTDVIPRLDHGVLADPLFDAAALHELDEAVQATLPVFMIDRHNHHTQLR